MSLRATVIALSCLLAGCSLARGTLGADGSAGGLDAQVEMVDAGSPLDDGASPDAAVTEDDAASPTDAALPVDAATIPDDVGIDASADPSCTELYGRASGFILCSEEYVDECAFYVTLGGGSCADVCGGSCLRGYNNGGSGDRCAHGTGEDTCDSTHTDEVCYCKRSAP